MHVYIAYRDLEQHLFENTLCGGPPSNSDYRLVLIKDSRYLLTRNRQNYAVPKDRAERFVEKVISGSTGKHPGFFPEIRELNGKKTAAVVEFSREARPDYYDFDDERLLAMLDALRAESDELMGRKALIDYTNPNPSLPEGDFELEGIYHQIHFTPPNTPGLIMQQVKQDTKDSFFRIYKTGVAFAVREGDICMEYDVPAGLMDEIKAQVRELCREPVGAYVENGAWEAYVGFGNKGDRIFTDPDRTFALLKKIASGCVPRKKEEAAASKCPVCGALRSEGRFCPECGAKLQ